MELGQLYLLNLLVTAAMFTVLIFRAWIEYRNFKTIWRELGWRQTRRNARQVLEAEKETFSKIDGGEELHAILCHLFEVERS